MVLVFTQKLAQKYTLAPSQNMSVLQNSVSVASFSFLIVQIRFIFQNKSHIVFLFRTFSLQNFFFPIYPKILLHHPSNSYSYTFLAPTPHPCLVLSPHLTTHAFIRSIYPSKYQSQDINASTTSLLLTPLLHLTMKLPLIPNTLLPRTTILVLLDSTILPIICQCLGNDLSFLLPFFIFPCT